MVRSGVNQATWLHALDDCFGEVDSRDSVLTTVGSDDEILSPVHVDVHEKDTAIPRKGGKFVGKRVSLVGEGAPSAEVVGVLVERGSDLSDDTREALRTVVPALLVVCDGDDDLTLGEVAFVRHDEVQEVVGGSVGDL